MVELNYTFNNISDFYKECTISTEYGRPSETKRFLEEENKEFKGLSLEEINKSKYSYKKGLDKLEDIKININVGGSKHKYKYDEFDGDDMNYDRMLEGFPPMLKRIRNIGIGSGKLINIFVIISENCTISSEAMLIKALTSIKIIDILENLGYRVAVYACDYTQDNNGSYKNERGVKYTLKVCLKKHEDSLNKGLILTGISPWFFRHYMFAHQSGHYKTGWGLGSSIKCTEKQTKENIIINHGECLTEKDAEEKIKTISKLFE